MNQLTLQSEVTTKPSKLCVALELSSKDWRLAFHDGSRMRERTVPAGDMTKLREEIATTRAKWSLPEARIFSCYEAGRDGFWPHRELAVAGVENIVVDSASIEVNRRARRAKTDALDARKLATQLWRKVVHGEQGALRAVRVPTVEEEDQRRWVRERERLMSEKKQHESRVCALLTLHGMKLAVKKGFKDAVAAAPARGTGTLPELARAEVLREYERLELVQKQLHELEKARARELKKPTKLTEVVAQLMTLCGLGEETGWTFGAELFAWRKFKNRREVGAMSGLVPTPYDSGGTDREQGISKAGSKRIRTLAIEIAWCWVRFQPESELTKWFERRFTGSARLRRVGIVAVARRLVIALWRFVTTGEVPEGARLKSEKVTTR